MYMKVCPECEGKSYSASKQGKWACPYCGKDITFQETWLAGSSKTEKTKDNIDKGEP